MSFWSHLNNALTDRIKWGMQKKKGFCWEGASNAGIIFFPPFRSRQVILHLSHFHPTLDSFSALLGSSAPWLTDPCTLHQSAPLTQSWTPSIGDNAKGRQGIRERSGQSPSLSASVPHPQQQLHPPRSQLCRGAPLGDSSSHWAFVTVFVTPLASSLQRLKQCPTAIGLGVTHHLQFVISTLSTSL